jgi:hypothetical protein
MSMAGQTRPPMPNPGDWTDTAGVCAMINRTRATVSDMVRMGTLKRYQAGGTYIFWVPEVREVADAMERLSRR